MRAFFISHNSIDKSWAEWIAWQLEEAGYSTVLDAWDFRPGSNFVLEMDDATRRAESTIAVLSPDYLSSRFAQSEWTAAFAKDPLSAGQTLLPIRVRPCTIVGVLAQIVYLDIVGLDEATARKRLIDHICGTRAKPSNPPKFPGARHHRVLMPQFPGADSSFIKGDGRKSDNTFRVSGEHFARFYRKPLAPVFSFKIRREASEGSGAASKLRRLAESIGEIYNDLYKRELIANNEKLAYCIDALRTSQARTETAEVQKALKNDADLRDRLWLDLQEAGELVEQLSHSVESADARMCLKKLHRKVLDVKKRTQI